MASEKLINKPSNRVIQGDNIGFMQAKVAAAATVTYLIPGKLVINKTNDNEIDIAGTADASNNLGIIGYEDTPVDYKPASITTAYAVGDIVAVHNTPGMRFKGWLMNSGAVFPGARLYHPIADSSGNFALYAPTSATAAAHTTPNAPGEHYQAIALESITAAATAGTSAVACWMQWVG